MRSYSLGLGTYLVTLALLGTSAGCRTTGDSARADVLPDAALRASPSATPSLPAADAGTKPGVVARDPASTSAPGPATVERIRVPGDLTASVVRGPTSAPPTTIFLPGICSNANAYLQGFPEAARKQGGVVAIEGDQPCGDGGFRSFSWDATKQHARIEAALASAGLTAIPAEGLTLVGYSQGAAIGEQLVARWPKRYTRVVLIGAPTEPSPKQLAPARAVVMMACQRDVTARMIAAKNACAKAGIPAQYVEMPGCTHGNLADGNRVFDEAFGFLASNARAIPADAAPIPLVGPVRD